MRKRANIIIVFSSTITFILLYSLGFANPFLLFLFTIPFYLINLIFYSETRLFIAYNFVTIVALFGYFFYINYSEGPPLNLVLLAMTDIGKFISFFLMFGLVLQNKINKIVERIIIYLNLYNIIFLSLTRYSTSAFIANFIGYERNVRDTTFVVFEIIFLITYFLNAFAKSYIIIKLDKRKNIRINKEKRRQERISEQFY